MSRRLLHPIRLASYCLLLFAFGHTFGAVIEVPRFGTASGAVVTAMQSVHLRVQGADCTWFGFYRGFGYFVGIYLVLAAMLAWLAGGMTSKTRSALLPVAWALLAVQVVNLPLTFLYFFPAPIAFQSAIAALLTIGCVVETRRARRERAAVSPQPA